MNPEKVAAFYASRGYRVIQTKSCWWYNEYHQQRVYQAFPLHRAVTPDAGELNDLFRQAPKAVMARFLSPWEAAGMASGMWVCRGPYDLLRLRRNSRNHTRRGLENCQVRKLSWTELMEKGWEAHRDTCARHGEGTPSTLGFDDGLAQCAAFEPWGAFVQDQLAAYLVTLSVEDWVHIIIARSANAYLKYSPNNAVVFTMIKEVLARSGVTTVTYGAESIVARTSLDHFKTGMGFEKTSIRQRVVVRPSLKALINAPSCWLMEKVAAFPKLRSHNRLQTIAGFCRAIRCS